MLNYSIMPLNKEHLNEICEDIAYQIHHDIATMPLFCFTLTPEGDPAIDKAGICCETYDKYKKKLDGMGLPSGVLIQASIGHGYVLNHPSAFQKYVGLSDGKSIRVCCPLDKGFQKYIRDSAARIASSHPHHIMLDDDFRLIARPAHGCACPLHMARLGTLLGHEITREELWERISGERDAECERLRDLFIQTQLDSLVECAREIRNGIDSIDPSIPGSYCLCGIAAEAAYEIALIMAGKGNPTVLRVNNANYCAENPRVFVKCLQRAALQLNALSGKPDVVLAETDTCPQNRYSTPATKLHSHFTFSILEGMGGAKHWITRLSSYEPTSGKAYRKKLATHAGFYRELSRLTPELVWLGCRLPVPKKPYYRLTDTDVNLEGSKGWGSHVLDRMGFPTHFSESHESVCFFDGARDQVFTDEELTSFLSGKVVLDAPAAESMIARGFGKYLGVNVKQRAANAKNTSGEIIYPNGFSAAQYGVRELIPLSDQVTRCSDVYFLRDGVEREILFPGVTSYKNELGGTAVVFSGDSDFPFKLVDAFGFLNETRKGQLAQILRDLDCLPVYYPDDAEVYLRAARTTDGKLFCALLDMSLDTIDELPLVTERPIRRIQRLLPDGTYEDVSFTQKGDRAELSLTAYPFDPVILLLETK